MKKITLLLFCFFFTMTIFAQQETNTSFKTQMTAMFSALDKTKIPNGILLDYGMEFANVPIYDGTLTDSTYSDISSIKKIYNTLLTSRILDIPSSSPTGKPLPYYESFVIPQEYDTKLNNNRSTGTVTVSGLYFKYARFVANATVNNKLTFANNQFSDKFINGVWQNPYQEMQTFVMASATKQYDGLNLQVKIPNDIFFSNNRNLIQNIQIDFGNDQGYVIVPFDTNIAVAYSVEGVKIWKYKLTLTDGTVLYNQSRIKILQGINSIPFDGGSTSAKSLLASGSYLYSKDITATLPYSGGYGTVKLTIDLGAGHSQITKPLIVAEGFDLGVVLSPETPNGMNTYTQFKQSILNGGSTDLNNLIWASNKQYDIIYVDWNNGVDYLQRNAYALETVINWVNSVKVGTEKNVVLGQSMGGVIARYALADMEQKGEDHKTRLFVSHDAPQQGANIPLSIQYLYRHLTNQYIQTNTTLFGGIVTVPIFENYGVSNYLSILDAPASRQLLKNFSTINYTIDNSINTSFYDELKNKGVANSGGYPVNCKNIAISNGGECGTTQNFNAGDDLLNYSYNKGLSFWGDLASLVYNPLGGAIGGLFLDNDFFGVAVLGGIPGNSRYKVDFNAKSLYTTSGNQIYNGRVSYTKKILWLFNVTIPITDVQISQPSGILPFDTYGGGYFDTKTIAGSTSMPSLYIRDHYGFIPTASALDIGKRNIILDDADYKRSYVGAMPPVAPKNSPFANFTTDFDRYNPNAQNKQHISFDARNGNWLAKELSLTPEQSNCSYICSDVQIIGSDGLCGSAGSYSAPSGVINYTWSVTTGANLVTLSGNGTNSIVLTPTTSTSSGLVTLSLSFGSDICGYRTITKTIKSYTINKPPLPSGSFSVNAVDCYNDGALPITFNPNNNFYGDITLTPSILPHPLQSQTKNITVKYTNPCTGAYTSKVIAFYYQAPNCSSAKMSNVTSLYQIYPNPSSDIVNIDLRDLNSQPDKDSTISGELFDMMGQSKSKVEIKDNQATFSVHRLNKGIYVLKISIDGKEESHQIAVK